MQQVLKALLVLGLASLLQATRGQRASVRMRHGGRRRDQMIRLLLDSSVMPQIAIKTDSAIANTSLSPWAYRESTVESRLPRQISHAHCLTSGCLTMQGEEEDAALVAQPIYYQVLVLNRVHRRSHTNRRARKVTTGYVFQLGTEIIPVGCTCVRPSVVP